ncbi:hypothetical protein [Massilia niabensis]|uniref:Uncharacterized protein n=1 Tax=Massilia niabensis TaxID=544910 RepID=A0ABW0LB90_9BURK
MANAMATHEDPSGDYALFHVEFDAAVDKTLEHKIVSFHERHDRPDMYLRCILFYMSADQQFSPILTCSVFRA